jgi:hypothetical protein
MPPNGNAGRQHEVELAERVAHVEVALEPDERLHVLLEDRVGVHLSGAGAPHVQAQRAVLGARRHAGDAVLQHGPGSRRESDEVGADRLGRGKAPPIDRRRTGRGGAANGRAAAPRAIGGVQRRACAQRPVGDDLPAARGVDLECDPRLQVRLVERRKELLCVGRHEQCVEVACVVARIVVADDRGAGRCDRGGEVEDEGVRAGAQQRGGHDDVVVPQHRLERLPVRHAAVERNTPEIEDQRPGAGGTVEADLDATRRAHAVRHIQTQVVGEVADRARPLARECDGNPGRAQLRVHPRLRRVRCGRSAGRRRVTRRHPR